MPESNTSDIEEQDTSKPVRPSVLTIDRMVGLLGLAVGFASLFYAVKINSHKELSVYYSIKDKLIFDSSLSDGLVVSDTSGVMLEGDVYLNEIVLWNSGDEIIEYEDLMRPMEIGSDSTEQIISVTVSAQDSLAVGEFAVYPSDSNGYVIKWNRLHPESFVTLTVLSQSDRGAPSQSLYAGGHSRVVVIKEVPVVQTFGLKIWAVTQIVGPIVGIALLWIILKSYLVKGRFRIFYKSLETRKDRNGFRLFVFILISIISFETVQMAYRAFVVYTAPSLPW